MCVTVDAEFAHNMTALVPICDLLQVRDSMSIARSSFSHFKTIFLPLSVTLQFPCDSVLLMTVQRIMKMPCLSAAEETQLCSEIVSLLHQMSSLNMALELAMNVVDRLKSREG